MRPPSLWRAWVGLWCLHPLWRSPFFFLRRLRVRLAVMREEAPGCGLFTAGLWCSPLGFVCAFVGLFLVFVGLVYTSLFNTPTTHTHTHTPHTHTHTHTHKPPQRRSCGEAHRPKSLEDPARVPLPATRPPRARQTARRRGMAGAGGAMAPRAGGSRGAEDAVSSVGGARLLALLTHPLQKTLLAAERDRVSAARGYRL